MEIPDIRRKIMSKIINCKDFISMCSIDKLSRNLSSQKYFWNNFLEELGFPLPLSSYNFKTVNGWILEFQKIKIGYERALSVLNKIENKLLSVPFKNPYKDDDELFTPPDPTEANETGLEISVSECPNPDPFIVEGVNEDTVRLVYNKYSNDLYHLTKTGYFTHHNYSTYTESDAIRPFVRLIYDEKFYLEIHYYDIVMEHRLELIERFKISRESMLHILYNLLSHGIIPQNINGVLFPH